MMDDLITKLGLYIATLCSIIVLNFPHKFMTSFIILAVEVLLFEVIKPWFSNIYKTSLYEKKREQLHKVVENTHQGSQYIILYQYLQEKMRDGPPVDMSLDEFIIVLSFLDYYKNSKCIVKDIFTQPYFDQYFLYLQNSLPNKSIKTEHLEEIFRDAKNKLTAIGVWTRYNRNKSVKRWYSRMIENYDWLYIDLEMACKNRNDKLTVKEFIKTLFGC